jgi:anti-anti-sigma regulatory factor
MWQRLITWRERLPYTDRLERQQALLLQNVELGIIVATVLTLPITLFNQRGFNANLFTLLVLVTVILCTAGSLILLRRGRQSASALLIALTLVVALGVMLFAIGWRYAGVVLFAFGLPIAISGMLAGRRSTVVVCVASAGVVATSTALELWGFPGAGIAAAPGGNVVGSVFGFIVQAALLGFFVESLRGQTTEAIAARRERERELEALSRRLELTVRERTADLEIAMSALEQRAADAERLLEENRRQRGAIRALSVPVLPIDGRTLVMPLVGELDGERLADVQDQALEAVQRLAARRLMLDITGVPVVDTHVAQSLMRTLTAVRLLGAQVVLVGVRPEVAQAIVGLGIDLGAIPAYADLQSALR